MEQHERFKIPRSDASSDLILTNSSKSTFNSLGGSVCAMIVVLLAIAMSEC